MVEAQLKKGAGIQMVSGCIDSQKPHFMFGIGNADADFDSWKAAAACPFNYAFYPIVPSGASFFADADLSRFKAIAGLGNPERKYENTRHNIGFEVMDALAEKYNINMNIRKHKAICGTGMVQLQHSRRINAPFTKW